MSSYVETGNPRPAPPVPPYYGAAINGVGTSSGPFTVAQYAAWRSVSLTTAQAILDQAVADGVVQVV